MPDTIAEPLGWAQQLQMGLGVILLIAIYLFGVWLRNYVFPTESTGPINRQLLAGLPIGLITMGMYGKTALPALDYTKSPFVFDITIMVGNVIIFGMLSRESLDKIKEHFSRGPILPSTKDPSAPGI